MGENSSDAFSDAGPVVVGAVPNNLIVGNGRFRKTLDRCLVGGRGVRAVVQMLVLVPSAGAMPGMAMRMLRYAGPPGADACRRGQRECVGAEHTGAEEGGPTLVSERGERRQSGSRSEGGCARQG